MARPKNHPGTVREVYSRRLREARVHRDWTQQQLADAMKNIGFPVDRATIAKIERGSRPLEVSELVAFAAALDVPPAGLFLDPAAETVALTDKVVLDSAKAADWAYGGGSVNPENARTYFLESPGFQPGPYARPGPGAAGMEWPDVPPHPTGSA